MAVVTLLIPVAALAQTFSQQGFVEAISTTHPQTTPNDDEHLIGDLLVRWDPSLKRGRWRADLSIDGRFDSKHMADRDADITFWDRTTQRPMFAVRRLSTTWSGGPLTVELGKQFVRWGKTDILIPTDRFAPRDYIAVVTTEILAVTAARATLASATDSVELVYTPRMTPSRLPLWNQRWAMTRPAQVRDLTIVDGGADFPEGPQYGIRWNHVGRYLEGSLSVFRGFSHLPMIQTTVVPSPPQIEVRRVYPQLMTFGFDVAVPLPWVTVKAESAWFRSETPQADEFVQFVIQLERQVGEWLLLGGYAGEHVTESWDHFRFAPDRGLARAFVGRASLTIDTNRSLVFEGIARENAQGFLQKFEYSHAMGAHNRVTAGIGVIAGDQNDFLGQYQRNSYATLTFRYSY